MASSMRLWHSWQRQLREMLPMIRVTRVNGLALLVLGMVWSGSVALTQIAAAVPLRVADSSTERRLRRWLANDHVDVALIWAALLPVLLRRVATPRPVFVFDPTPQQDRFTLLSLGVVVHRRVLPVAWRLVPQQTAWDTPLAPLVRAMLSEVTAALPAEATPTLLVDRGLTSAALIDVCRELGWHFVFRLNAGPTQTHRVRMPDGTEHDLWRLVTKPGQRWSGTVALFKQAGWRTVALTIRWERGQTTPWVLCADELTGGACVQCYRLRGRCEASYLDGKSRGWQLEATKVTDPARLNRLLLGLALAFWWTHQLGRQVMRAGQRTRFDRHDRRDLSLIKLGRRAFADALDHHRLPALLFTFHHHAWHLLASA